MEKQKERIKKMQGHLGNVGDNMAIERYYYDGNDIVIEIKKDGEWVKVK